MRVLPNTSHGRGLWARLVVVPLAFAGVALMPATPPVAHPAASAGSGFAAGTYEVNRNVATNHTQSGKFYVEWQIATAGYRAGDRAAYCVATPTGAATLRTTVSYVSNGYNHAFISSDGLTHEIWSASGVKSVSNATVSVAVAGTTSICFGNAVDAGTTTYPAARYISVSAFTFAAAAPPSGGCPASGPNATCTGVPAGTSLTVVHGDITITKAGTVIKDEDIYGSIKISASNVTIEDSRIRGESTVNTKWKPVVWAPDGHTNIQLLHDEIYASHPSVYTDTMHLYNTTVDYVNAHGGVDGAKALSGTTIENSYIHDLTWFDHDPAQSGGHTHNDDVQIVGGSNITVRNNTLSATKGFNSAIQVTEDIAAVSDMTITGNHADGGSCTFNLDGDKQGPFKNSSVTNNVFGRDMEYTNCAIIRTLPSLTTYTNNTWADTGQQVRLSNGGD